MLPKWLTPWRTRVEHLPTPGLTGRGRESSTDLTQRLNFYQPPAVSYLAELMLKAREVPDAATAATAAEIVYDEYVRRRALDEPGDASDDGRRFRERLLGWIHESHWRYGRDRTPRGRAVARLTPEPTSFADHTRTDVYKRALARLAQTSAFDARLIPLLHEHHEETGCLARARQLLAGEFPDRCQSSVAFKRAAGRARDRFGVVLVELAETALPGKEAEDVLDYLESLDLDKFARQSDTVRTRFGLPDDGRCS